MNAAPVILGYFVPIILVVILFVLFKVERPSLPVFERPQTEVRTALFLFAILGVIVVVSAAVLKPVHDTSNLTTASMAYSSLLYAVFLLPFIAALVVRRQGLHTCLIPRKGVLFHLTVSIAMGFFSIPVYLLAVGKISMLPYALSNLFTVSSLFFLVPILMEEFIFRGFLLTRFTAGLGKHKGVLLSAVMFGLYHYPRYLLSSHMGFLATTQIVILIIAVSVGGGYGIYSIRCMFYGVFIHWCMDIVQTSIPPR